MHGVGNVTMTVRTYVNEEAHVAHHAVGACAHYLTQREQLRRILRVGGISPLPSQTHTFLHKILPNLSFHL